MEFEWDETKRVKNIEQHGIDFLKARILFSERLVVTNAKTVAGESRLMATGLLDNVYVTAIYTMRGDIIRVISLRRARNEEREQHQEIYSS